MTDQGLREQQKWTTPQLKPKVYIYPLKNNHHFIFKLILNQTILDHSDWPNDFSNCFFQNYEKMFLISKSPVVCLHFQSVFTDREELPLHCMTTQASSHILRYFLLTELVQSRPALLSYTFADLSICIIYISGLGLESEKIMTLF